MLQFERKLDTCDDNDLPINFVSCTHHRCSLFCEYRKPLKYSDNINTIVEQLWVGR